MVKTASEIDLAEFIDHSLLSPIATSEHVMQWCAEADQYGFAAVCIYPMHVPQAVDLLHHKKPKVCAVIGFPSGATTSATKLYEAEEAVERGASELDVMINLAWIKMGQVDAVHQEMAEIVSATGVPIKAIIETHLLTDAEKRLAAEACMDAGVAFLKTNTGWCGEATVADVRLLKSITQDRIGIKAASGIHTAEQAIELILAGATRLGTSRGTALVRQRDTLEEDNSK